MDEGPTVGGLQLDSGPVVTDDRQELRFVGEQGWLPQFRDLLPADVLALAECANRSDLITAGRIEVCRALSIQLTQRRPPRPRLGIDEQRPNRFPRRCGEGRNGVVEHDVLLFIAW